MKLNALKDLLAHELQDLHSAEQQLTEALPKMVKAANSPELKAALEEHLAQTQTQLDRVTTLLERLELKPGRVKCAGMAGIVKEGSDILGEDGNPSVKDAAIIGAAQRVEHYEMAGYGTARTLAQTLGLDDVADVLQLILDEEKAADEKLTEIAEQINQDADDAGESETKTSKR